MVSDKQLQQGGAFFSREGDLPPAEFLFLPKVDKKKSLEAGHDVYVEREYIKILKQGGDVQHFPVNEEFKKRYPLQWDAFQKGQKEPQVGMPLEKWPGCNRAECENLKRVNIFTVEQLAEATDVVFQSYGMGGRLLQKKAAEYLEAASGDGAIVARLNDLEKKFGATEEANQQLTKVNDELASENKELRSGVTPDDDKLKQRVEDLEGFLEKATSENDALKEQVKKLKAK